MTLAHAVPLDEIREAARRLRGIAYHTPLVSFASPNPAKEIFLKLENLQPIGSFKLRGAGNAILSAPTEELDGGVYTASAGNMAQGVSWIAQRFGIACTAVVPDHAPSTKLAAIHRYGSNIIKVPFDEWWEILMTHHYAGCSGFFVHPVSDPAVIAGNGTIGLELFEDEPEIDTVLVPYGGGGLSSGIASAIKALRPSVQVFACEVETAAPLAASLAAKQPVAIPYTPSFVDGIGGKSLLPEMWPMVSSLLDGSIVVTLAEIASAIRNMAEQNRVIAEGAGAASLAAALSGKAPGRKIACIVSGGNIDSEKLALILRNQIP